MHTNLPKINFDSSNLLDIEVMSLSDTYRRLKKIENHDPFTPHKIKFYFIIVIIEGEYTHFLDFNYYKLTEGSIMFVAKDQVHHFTEDLKFANGFSIVLNSEFLEKKYFLSDTIKLHRLYNYHITNPVIHQHEMNSDGFKMLVNELYKEYTNTNMYAKEEILSTLIHFLLLKAERIQQKRVIPNIKTNWIQLFNKFTELLDKKHVTTRSSRFYAKELLISYKLLNEVIKKLTNKTAKEFIDHFVTTEIKRYLVSTSLSIKEISYKTGFEEPSNMVKFFKRNTSLTPIQFRDSV